MAQKTWSINRDHSTMAGYDSGNSVDNHHPVGRNTSPTPDYIWRPLLEFVLDWTGVVQITSAVLRVRTSTHVHITFGASPRMTIWQVMASWANTGGSEGTWSSSANPKDSTQPSHSGGVSVDSGVLTTSYETTQDIDITAIVNRWAPASVKQSGGSPGPGDANYGIKCIGYNEAGTNANWEFYSKESAYDPVIILTYTTNAPPTAPTLVSPATGSTVSSQTPTLSFNHNDPDSDPCASWDIEVDATSGNGVEPDWAGLAYSAYNQTDDLTNPIARVVGTTLTRGQWYAWRARTADATNGDGAWMATAWFYVGQLPTVTMTQPLATSLAKLYYVAGSGTTPKFQAEWNYSCPDGHAQASAVVRVYNTSDVLQHTHNHSGAATTAQLSGYAPANGTQYKVEMDVTCSAGITSTVTARVTTRARWGRGAWYHDIGSTPVGWGTPTVNTNLPANTAVVLEYGSTASAAAEPSTWYATLGEAALQRYVWHRPTLIAWGTSPSSPSVLDVTVAWSSTSLTPDDWTMAGIASIDPGSYVYGTQSLKHANTAAGGEERSYQVITVLPNTVYTVAARIKSQGNSKASIRIEEADGSSVIVTSPDVGVTQDFTAITPISFNSGGRTQVRITCRTVKDVASTNAWFDITKVEAGGVATPWTPGFIGGATALDAGGVQVNAQAGGVFRLKGSTGGARDIVELGANGLRFGGDTDVLSASAGTLRVKGATSGWVQAQAQSGALAAFSAQVAGDTVERVTLEGDATITGLNFGPGNAAQDIRVYRSSAKTLTLDDAAGGALTKVNIVGNALLRLGGTAFPSSPSDGDLFYRTDHEQWWTYDSTTSKWLSEWRHLQFSNTQTLPATAGGTHLRAIAPNMSSLGEDQIYIGSLTWTYYVVAASHDGSNYLRYQLYKTNNGGGTTVGGNPASDGATVAAWRSATQDISALSGTGYYMYEIAITEVGNPGGASGWYVVASMKYRLVAS